MNKAISQFIFVEQIIRHISFGTKLVKTLQLSLLGNSQRKYKRGEKPLVKIRKPEFLS